MPVSSELRAMLAERDKKRCAYCLTDEDNCGLKMHIDHIIPESAGGDTTPGNLCLACFSCNVFKGANQRWTDPLTKDIVILFHPIRQNWNDHFCWDESKTKITGLTPCGRATIEALKMNNPTVVSNRSHIFQD